MTFGTGRVTYNPDKSNCHLKKSEILPFYIYFIVPFTYPKVKFKSFFSTKIKR